MNKKYDCQIDLRQSFLGMGLLFVLAVLTILASIGLSEMEKQKAEGINFDYMWAFMQIWTILLIPFCLYITFFTKFQMPISRKKE